MTAEAFVQAVLAIADTQPVYRTGGLGRDGTCDCIGLILGALEKDYPLHSTNYFARYQTRNLRAVSPQETLRPGEIVYKARADQGTLNARYLSGGRYDTGDRTDYYHVGVVVGNDPLCIVHCTQTGEINGIAWDDRADRWQYAGMPADVEEMVTPIREALVRAGSGSSVNLRRQPSLAAARIARVPIDTAVQVIGEDGDWAKIITPDGLNGYMMKKYLTSAVPDLEKQLLALETRIAALEKAIG